MSFKYAEYVFVTVCLFLFWNLLNKLHIFSYMLYFTKFEFFLCWFSLFPLNIGHTSVIDVMLFYIWMTKMWPLRLEEKLLPGGLKRVPAAMKLMSLWSLCNETNTRRCGHWTHWHTTREQTALLLLLEVVVCVYVYLQVVPGDIQYIHWGLVFDYNPLLHAVICS